MTIGEVKQLFYDIVSSYHPKACIVWAKTKGVTPIPPFITLSYRNVSRSTFSLQDIEEGGPYYNYTMTFEVNLYTTGRELTKKDGSIYGYENTAVENLEEFTRFLDSEAMIDQVAEKNITIQLNSVIADLSELIGDTKFNYRAMAEFTVDFVGEAVGRYGVSNAMNTPNSSGGGKIDYKEAEMFEVDRIEIKEDIEENE